jgi:phosphoglycerate dehydrogenase-like enzyme
MLLRRFTWADAEVKNGNYAKFRARMVADNLSGLEGLLVGVIGFGTIGRAVAQAFHRMGCRISYFDPAMGDKTVADTIGARPMPLEALLAQADVVTLHVPLTPDTRRLIEIARRLPPVRIEKVRRMRRLVARGKLETPARLEGTARRLAKELVP